jgi:hypothetical protein
MARSGWAALAATIVLVAGLGSEPAFDAAVEANRQAEPLLRSLTEFPVWSAGTLGLDSDIYAAIAVKIVVLLALVFLVGRAAGRAGPSFAALLAGWGGTTLAAAVAGMAYVLVADMAVLDGQLADSQGGAGAVVVDGLNTGAIFGLYTGWVVGVAVVATARRDAAVPMVDGWEPSPAPAPMAGIDLVPGMPSVSAPVGGVAAGAGAGVGNGAEFDAWGAPPLSDPATRVVPGAPASTPAPSSIEGQPFVESGAWPRPVADAVGVLPTEETPAVAAAGWPSPTHPEADPLPGANGTGQPFIPSGNWPPSSRGSQAANGRPSPPSYDQPDLSGPAPPAGPTDPAGPTRPAESGEPARPLWPSAWPASSGGADHDAVRDDDESDQPDGANTRFW